jgi:hypothetical protein
MSFEKNFFSYLAQGLVIAVSVVAAGRILRVVS